MRILSLMVLLSNLYANYIKTFFVYLAHQLLY